MLCPLCRVYISRATNSKLQKARAKQSGDVSELIQDESSAVFRAGKWVSFRRG